MRLHKFLPAPFAIADIALRRLKAARLADLNDPFEFYAARVVDGAAREKLPDLKAEIDGRTGLLCFSRDWRNPVLWSHYAERHTGIVLGFDAADDDVRIVEYTADRLELGGAHDDAVPPDVVEQLLATKYRDWDYEQEARIVVPLDSLVQEGGLAYRPFDQRLVLREVRLGPRCTLAMDQARRLVEPFRDVRVTRTRLAIETFRITDESV
jgi:hypothetical protein